MDNISEFIIQLIKIVYYTFVVVVLFFSVFGIYILTKYGEKRDIALIVSIVFIVFFLGLLGNSYHSLLNISF